MRLAQNDASNYQSGLLNMVCTGLDAITRCVLQQTYYSVLLYYIYMHYSQLHECQKVPFHINKDSEMYTFFLFRFSPFSLQALRLSLGIK